MAKKHSMNQGAAEAAQLREALADPTNRALLVTLEPDGTLAHQPVGFGKSVLNLRTELQDHLSDGLYDASFFEDLRDYCEGMLAARAEARRTGGFVIPRAPGRWEIAHVPAWAPLAQGEQS